MAKKIKNIGVFTSGGDSPGMNACIRAVVRSSLYHQLNVTGIYRGYQGMIEGELKQMHSHSVSNIIQRGGTILKSARSNDFLSKEGRQKAFDHLQKAKIDALVAIGGDGTFKGAEVFSKEFNIPILGIPGTIDNDLFGTDFTIGYDTAINTAIDALDKIRDTADSHNRLFFVEVMGRDAGFIALRSGIGSGAEAVLVPELHTDTQTLLEKLKESEQKNKSSTIVVVAEGDETGGAFKIAEKVAQHYKHYDIKVTILGHLQRGGNPSCMDRVLASRLGVAAVEKIIKGENRKMVGIKNHNIILTPFEKAVKHTEKISTELYKLIDILSY